MQAVLSNPLMGLAGLLIGIAAGWYLNPFGQ